MTNSQYNNSINAWLETPLNWPTSEWFSSISPIKSHVIQDFLQEWQYTMDFNTMEEFSPLDNCKTLDKAYSRMHDLFVLNTGMTPTEFDNFYAWIQDHLGPYPNRRGIANPVLDFGSLGQEGVEGWLVPILEGGKEEGLVKDTDCNPWCTTTATGSSIAARARQRVNCAKLEHVRMCALAPGDKRKHGTGHTNTTRE